MWNGLIKWVSDLPWALRARALEAIRADRRQRRFMFLLLYFASKMRAVGHRLIRGTPRSFGAGIALMADKGLR